VPVTFFGKANRDRKDWSADQDLGYVSSPKFNFQWFRYVLDDFARTILDWIDLVLDVANSSHGVSIGWRRFIVGLHD
jgi:hypothetical protein